MKLTKDQRIELVRRFRHEKTTTMASLSRSYGISPQSVQKLLRKQGITETRRAKIQITNQQKCKIVILAKTRHSATEIGQQMGLSESIIRRHLADHSVQTEFQQAKAQRTTNVRDKIVADYIANIPMKVIEQRYSVSTGIIQKELTRRKIKRRNSRLGVFDQIPEDRLKVVRAAKAGAGLGFLAEIFNCSRDAIHRVFKEEGITPPKTRSQYRLVDRKGREHWMRSSWELKTASWLDEREIDWDYEKESYTLDEEGHTYTPDFWLYKPDGSLSLIIDVKGWLHDGSKWRIEAFQACYPNIPFELWDEVILVEKAILEREFQCPREFRSARGGGQFVLSGEEKRRALRLYEEDNASIEEIAIALRRGHSSIYMLMVALGVRRTRAETRMRRSATQEQRDEAFRLYQSGLSYVKVSKIVGISVDIIFHEVKRRGGGRSINVWSAEEDIVMKANYDSTSGGLTRCMNLLPNRSKAGIQVRAQKLKLTAKRGSPSKRRSLTNEQIRDAISMHSQGRSWCSIAKYFGVADHTLRKAREWYEEEKNV